MADNDCNISDSNTKTHGFEISDVTAASVPLSPSLHDSHDNGLTSLSTGGKGHAGFSKSFSKFFSSGRPVKTVDTSASTSINIISQGDADEPSNDVSNGTSHYYQVLGADPKAVAKQMVLASSEKFQAIGKAEFFYWLDKEQRSKATGIQQMSQHFNQVSLWVSYTVLQETQFKKRVQTISAFIAILKTSVDLCDFNTAVAVLAGLQSASVCRLEKTWSNLPKKDWTTFAQLGELLSPTTNWEHYRLLLRQTKPPCVPYLGLYLTDLAFLCEAKRRLINQSSSNERAVWEKEQQITSMLDELYVWKAFAKYSDIVPNSLLIQQVLSKLSVLGTEKVSVFEDNLYKRSLEIEPQISEPGSSPIALYFAGKSKLVTSRFDRRSSSFSTSNQRHRAMTSSGASSSHARPLSFSSSISLFPPINFSSAIPSKKSSGNPIWAKDGLELLSPTDSTSDSFLRLFSTGGAGDRASRHEKAKSAMPVISSFTPTAETNNQSSRASFDADIAGDIVAYRLDSDAAVINDVSLLRGRSVLGKPLLKFVCRFPLYKKNEYCSAGKRYSNRSWRHCALEIFTLERNVLASSSNGGHCEYYFVFVDQPSFPSLSDGSSDDIASFALTQLLLELDSCDAKKSGNRVSSVAQATVGELSVASMSLMSPLADSKVSESAPRDSQENALFQILAQTPESESKPDEASNRKQLLHDSKERVSLILRWTRLCLVNVAADYKKHKWTLRLRVPTTSLFGQFAEKTNILFDLLASYSVADSIFTAKGTKAREHGEDGPDAAVDFSTFLLRFTDESSMTVALDFFAGISPSHV